MQGRLPGLRPEWLDEGPQLVMEGPNEATARLNAQLGGGAYVSAQVEGAALTAINGSPELQKKVHAMKKPQTLYTLGKSSPLPDSAWHFPFQVYVRDVG